MMPTQEAFVGIVTVSELIRTFEVVNTLQILCSNLAEVKGCSTSVVEHYQ